MPIAWRGSGARRVLASLNHPNIATIYGVEESGSPRPDLWLLDFARGATTQLWVLPLNGQKKPVPFVRTEFSEREGCFSPDGRWVAYTSDASGRDEVYVRAFEPDSGETAYEGRKWLVSNSGGASPRWRADGKELYYVGANGRLTSVAVTTHPVFQAGVPRVRFQLLREYLAPRPHGT